MQVASPSVLDPSEQYKVDNVQMTSPSVTVSIQSEGMVCSHAATSPSVETSI